MDPLLEMKINLLLLLAKRDGNLADSEKALLISILSDFNLDESYLYEHQQEMIDFQIVSQMDDGIGLLYSVLGVIYADDPQGNLPYSSGIGADLTNDTDCEIFAQGVMKLPMVFQWQLTNH